MQIQKAQFIKYLQKNGRASATILAYAKDLDQLLVFLGKINLFEIKNVTTDHLEQFKQSLKDEKYTLKSISRRLSHQPRVSATPNTRLPPPASSPPSNIVPFATPSKTMFACMASSNSSSKRGSELANSPGSNSKTSHSRNLILKSAPLSPTMPDVSHSTIPPSPQSKNTSGVAPKPKIPPSLLPRPATPS